MPIYAAESDPANCPICNTELHSYNTKRIGNRAVCSNCQAKLIEAWYDYGDLIVVDAKAFGIESAIRKHGRPF